jgi:aldose 1-epimerase
MSSANHHTAAVLPRAQAWGRLADGRAVHRWTLRNAQGMRVDVADLGGSLLSWLAPDRQGRLGEVLLGHDNAAQYAESSAYMGALIGRWGNRIRDGRFTLDGVGYRLDRNNNGHHLHGGPEGFHQALWEVEPEGEGLRLALRSPDGEGGFPGNLDVEVLYRLHDDGRLSIDYEARCDLPTPVNLTSHPYFNLSGGRGSIGDHLLRIDAEDYLAVDGGLIPAAQESVAGTPFDFRNTAPLGARLAWPHPQLRIAGGFDHCYCLNDRHGKPSTVAEVYDPSSGRRLGVITDQPGLQLYTGQHLENVPARGGGHYRPGDGLCLEAQAFPDQINSAAAERVVLRPGQVYRQHTAYKLDVV